MGIQTSVEVEVLVEVLVVVAGFLGELSAFKI
jgi:hypothetical protein